MSDDQLKSIIERVSALPKHGSTASCWSSLSDSDNRHQYLIGPLVPFVGRDIPPISRARSAAGRMLGCTSETIRHRASVWKRRGSYLAAKEWAIDITGEPWPACDLPEDSVGYVYVLSCPAFPGLFKVGFSRDPGTRVRALSTQHKVQLKLEHVHVGTWFDEHIAHMSLIKFQMANEWFDMSGSWSGKLPLALFYTPHRMWNELNEYPATSPQPGRDPQSGDHGSDSGGRQVGESPVIKAGSEQESVVEPQARNEPGSGEAASGGERVTPLPETRPAVTRKPTAPIDLTIPSFLDRRQKPQAVA